MSKEIEGARVLEVVAKLQNFDTEHNARSDSILKWAITAARSLKEAFDEYVYKDITDMKEMLNMLALVQQEVDEERSMLRTTETKYLNIHDELNKIIDSAQQNKIKHIDFSTKDSYPPNYQNYPLPQGQYTESINKSEKSTQFEILDISIIIDAFMIIGEVEELRKKIDKVSRNYRRMISNMEGIFDEFLKRRGIGTN